MRTPRRPFFLHTCIYGSCAHYGAKDGCVLSYLDRRPFQTNLAEMADWVAAGLGAALGVGYEVATETGEAPGVEEQGVEVVGLDLAPARCLRSGGARQCGGPTAAHR
jgi:hypothetical protein